MVDGMADDAGLNVLQVEREVGVDDADAMEHHRQTHLLGRFKDRVVHAVAPERTQAGDREVDGNEAVVGAVGANLVGRVLRDPGGRPGRRHRGPFRG